MGRNFETVEKLTKSIKSTTTPTTLAINGLSMDGSLSVSGAVTLGDDVAISGELTVPMITTPGIAASGAAIAAGSGAVSTKLGAPEVDVIVIADEIITTIKVDLTGLKSKSDADDVIGLETEAPPAYLTQVTTATNGVIHKVQMTCVELPTADANVLLDINLTSAAAADGGYDADGSGYTLLIDSNGNYAAGTTKTAAAGTNPTPNHYLYLTDGATHTAASVFTAGQFVIKLFGYAVRS